MTRTGLRVVQKLQKSVIWTRLSGTALHPGQELSCQGFPVTSLVCFSILAVLQNAKQREMKNVLLLSSAQYLPSLDWSHSASAATIRHRIQEVQGSREIGSIEKRSRMKQLKTRKDKANPVNVCTSPPHPCTHIDHRSVESPTDQSQ